ncbi:MAG: DUF4189 domain-containing protein [Alphaproteobacteria bacterium]|nr:DUF4189 domain-containing protein [Alphaproteobacteria bacterium]
MRKLILAATLCLVAAPAYASHSTWSAIAISGQTGDWGRSYDWWSKQEAIDAAMKYCKNNGATDCKLATWAQGNYCAAVAVKKYSDGTVAWGSASAHRLTDARSKAMDVCAQYADEPCDQVEVDICGNVDD